MQHPIVDALPKWLLFFLSKIYGLVSAVRNNLYDAGILKSYTVKLPVVCVGNLTVGGNAKTPLCIHLVEVLKKRGYSPTILTRGYGGSIKGPHILKETDLASQVGDEALLISRVTKVPVMIASDRLAGARAIEEQKLGDIIVMDDGFQHRRLNRTVNILSVNSSSPEAITEFMKGQLLPLGMFRENMKAGLQRAHILIFADRKVSKETVSLPEEVFKVLPEDLKIFRASLKFIGVYNLLDSSELKAKDVLAFSAIANPDGFYATLKSSQFNVLEKFVFPDHHSFSREDLETIRKSFPNTPIICTAKDAVKIPLDWAKDLYQLQVNIDVTPADAFKVQLLKCLMKQN